MRFRIRSRESCHRCCVRRRRPGRRYTAHRRWHSQAANNRGVLEHIAIVNAETGGGFGGEVEFSIDELQFTPSWIPPSPHGRRADYRRRHQRNGDRRAGRADRVTVAKSRRFGFQTVSLRPGRSASPPTTPTPARSSPPRNGASSEVRLNPSASRSRPKPRRSACRSCLMKTATSPTRPAGSSWGRKPCEPPGGDIVPNGCRDPSRQRRLDHRLHRRSVARLARHGVVAPSGNFCLRRCGSMCSPRRDRTA